MKKIHSLLFLLLFVVAQSFSQWTTSGSNIYNTNTDFVGIGTLAPAYKLDVFGPSGSWSGRFRGSTSSNNSFGLLIDAGTSSSDAPLIIRNTSQSEILFSVRGNGNVGIGTASPAFKFDVMGPNGDWSGRFRGSTSSNNSYGLLIDAGTSSSDAPLIIRNASQSETFFSVRGNGNIGIGMISPTEKLCVNGTIIAQKIKVTQAGWPDYVFDKKYKLPNLFSVESFIKKYKHLPQIPSTQEVKENGISVGEIQALLLEKIEELTLYVIEQQKEIKKLKKKVFQNHH